MKLDTLRIGQKVLELNDMTNNGVKFPEDYQTFILDDFEFVFEYDFQFVGTEYDDFTETENDIYEPFLTKLIEVINIDTDEVIMLNENQSKLVLKIAQSKI